MTRAVARAASMTLHVDRIRCDGYGMGAELLPELIELDDWGYPIVRPDAVPVVRSVALSKHERDHRAIRSSPPT